MNYSSEELSELDTRLKATFTLIRTKLEESQTVKRKCLVSQNELNYWPELLVCLFQELSIRGGLPESAEIRTTCRAPSWRWHDRLLHSKVCQRHLTIKVLKPCSKLNFPPYSFQTSIVSILLLIDSLSNWTQAGTSLKAEFCKIIFIKSASFKIIVKKCTLKIYVHIFSTELFPCKPTSYSCCSPPPLHTF